MRTEQPTQFIKDAHVTNTINYERLGSIPFRSGNHLLAQPGIAVLLD